MEIQISPSILKLILVVLFIHFGKVTPHDCFAPDQFFPHESDKTRFYACTTDNEKVEMQCPNSMEFDPAIEKCEKIRTLNPVLSHTGSHHLPNYPDAPVHTSSLNMHPGIHLQQPKPSGAPFRSNGVSFRSQPLYFTHFSDNSHHYKPPHLTSGYQPYHPHHHSLDYGENGPSDYSPYGKPSQGSYLYPNFGTQAFYEMKKHQKNDKSKGKHGHHFTKPEYFGSPRI